MSWEDYIVKLRSASDIIAGQSPEGKYYNDNGEGLPFYQGKKLFKEKYLGEPTTWTTKVTKEAIEGDILMSVRAPVGPVNFTTQKICIGRGLAAIRAKENLNKEYLYYFLLKHEAEIESNEGAVFNSINKTQIGNINIPVPPLSEQKEIVVILDKAFEAIDKAKTNIEKNIENAKELFQSKLNEVFSQKGEGWEEKRLGEVCLLQRGFDLPTRLRESGIYPLISSSGITDSIQDFKIMAPGVITGRSGSIGNVFYIENNFWPLNTTLYIKEFFGNNHKYIYYLLRKFDLKKYSSGSGVPTLNRNFVHDETITTTNKIDDQIHIVKILDKLEFSLQQSKCYYKKSIDLLEDLKKSILQKAFSGELTNKAVDLGIEQALDMAAEPEERYI